MTFSQLSFHKTASFFQFIMWTISTLLQFIVEWINPTLFQPVVWTISSLIHWINPLSTWNQFWSLMGQLMWMVRKMLICNLPNIIIMRIYVKMSKEISFLKKNGIFLYLFYFQLPPLITMIESWPNIVVWYFFILIVNCSGIAYCAELDLLGSVICLFILALLYLYLIGLWLIPMICFQISIFGLIVGLD